jgi:chorismate mutase
MSQNIESLRDEITQINEKIIDLIAKRIETAEKIGELKKQHNQPIHQPDQEAKVLEFCQQKAREKGVDPNGIESVFTAIIAMSRERQKDN